MVHGMFQTMIQEMVREMVQEVQEVGDLGEEGRYLQMPWHSLTPAMAIS